MSDTVKCKKFHALNMEPEWQGMVLLKPAGYLLDRRGIFLNGAGFKRDIGGVSQLLGT